MSALENMPAEAPVEVAISSERLAETIERLRGGETFVTLPVDSVAARAAALEAVLDGVLDGETRVAWVSNPLRSPLTLERFFLQAVGPDADLRVERSEAELAAMLARSIGGERRLLVVVQQPETMDAELRERLSGLPGAWPADGVGVQFLFSGTSGFRAPEVRRTRVLTASAPMVVVRRLEADEADEDSPKRRERLPAVLLGALVGLGLFVVSPFSASGPERVPSPGAEEAERPVAAPAGVAEGAAPIVSPPASAAETQPVGMDIAALRREFDAFLAQRSPQLAAMPDAQKDALFREFLQRHGRPAP